MMKKKEMLFASLAIGFFMFGTISSFWLNENFSVIYEYNSKKGGAMVHAGGRPLFVVTRKQRDGKWYKRISFEHNKTILSERAGHVSGNYVSCTYHSIEDGFLSMIILNGVACAELGYHDFMNFMKQQEEILKK